jgi:hypothetical protein
MSTDLFVAMLNQVMRRRRRPCSPQHRIEADLTQENRALVRSFFKAPVVAYIADG